MSENHPDDNPTTEIGRHGVYVAALLMAAGVYCAFIGSAWAALICGAWSAAVFMEDHHG